MLIQKEETEPGMDKLKSIVYTIANLQDEINEKTMLTQRLLEESPGNRSGWRKIWTIPSGAGTAQNISLPPPRKRQPINTARPAPC